MTKKVKYRALPPLLIHPTNVKSSAKGQEIISPSKLATPQSAPTQSIRPAMKTTVAGEKKLAEMLKQQEDLAKETEDAKTEFEMKIAAIIEKNTKLQTELEKMTAGVKTTEPTLPPSSKQRSPSIETYAEKVANKKLQSPDPEMFLERQTLEKVSSIPSTPEVKSAASLYSAKVKNFSQSSPDSVKFTTHPLLHKKTPPSSPDAAKFTSPPSLLPKEAAKAPSTPETILETPKKITTPEPLASEIKTIEASTEAKKIPEMIKSVPEPMLWSQKVTKGLKMAEPAKAAQPLMEIQKNVSTPEHKATVPAPQQIEESPMKNTTTEISSPVPRAPAHKGKSPKKNSNMEPDVTSPQPKMEKNAWNINPTPGVNLHSPAKIVEETMKVSSAPDVKFTALKAEDRMEKPLKKLRDEKIKSTVPSAPEETSKKTSRPDVKTRPTTQKSSKCVKATTMRSTPQPVNAAVPSPSEGKKNTTAKTPEAPTKSETLAKSKEFTCAPAVILPIHYVELVMKKIAQLEMRKKSASNKIVKKQEVIAPSEMKINSCVQLIEALPDVPKTAVPSVETLLKSQSLEDLDDVFPPGLDSTVKLGELSPEPIVIRPDFVSATHIKPYLPYAHHALRHFNLVDTTELLTGRMMDGKLFLDEEMEEQKSFMGEELPMDGEAIEECQNNSPPTWKEATMMKCRREDVLKMETKAPESPVVQIMDRFNDFSHFGAVFVKEARAEVKVEEVAEKTTYAEKAKIKPKPIAPPPKKIIKPRIAASPSTKSSEEDLWTWNLESFRTEKPIEVMVETKADSGIDSLNNSKSSSPEVSAQCSPIQSPQLSSCSERKIRKKEKKMSAKMEWEEAKGRSNKGGMKNKDAITMSPKAKHAGSNSKGTNGWNVLKEQKEDVADSAPETSKSITFTERIRSGIAKLGKRVKRVKSNVTGMSLWEDSPDWTKEEMLMVLGIILVVLGVYMTFYVSGAFVRSFDRDAGECKSAEYMCYFEEDHSVSMLKANLNIEQTDISLTQKSTKMKEDDATSGQNGFCTSMLDYVLEATSFQERYQRALELADNRSFLKEMSAKLRPLKLVTLQKRRENSHDFGRIHCTETRRSPYTMEQRREAWDSLNEIITKEELLVFIMFDLDNIYIEYLWQETGHFTMELFRNNFIARTCLLLTGYL